MKCIAVDDEELALDLLADNIAKVPYLQLMGRFDNPIHAIECIQQQKVDLVFLDIQMPGLSGLQLIQSLPVKPMFILVTAYEKFALEGYNLNVVDYLVKPVALDRFITACNKAFEFYQLKRNNQEGGSPGQSWLFLNIDYSLVKINFHEVVWIEGLKDYIKIHLEGKDRPLIARASIKSMEQQLPQADFVRIHKSYIVSKKHITAIRKSSVYIKNLELNVGDSYKQAIIDLAGRQVE